MKNTILCTLLFYCGSVSSQLNEFIDIVSPAMSHPEESGFMRFQTPNSIQPGECFNLYKTIKVDANNDMILIKDWIDPQMQMHHYKYQQTYMGVPVEEAGCIEHYQGASLIFTNAKHVIGLDLNSTPTLTESEALKHLINYFPEDYIMAWEVDNYEMEIQQNTENPLASFYPSGELLIAIDNYDALTFNIPGNRYRLAYKFDVKVINPDILATYWVDANTGTVFKQLSRKQHGFAQINNEGSFTNHLIDDKYRNFTNDYILRTDNPNWANIHTKPWAFNDAWWTLSQYSNNSSSWGLSNSSATSAHWHTEKTWDYFLTKFGRNSLDGTNSEIRILNNIPGSVLEAEFYNEGNKDYIVLTNANGYTYGENIDVIAHEYTHGIVLHTSVLGVTNEPGALNESFADIFGIMVKKHVYQDNSNDLWLLTGPSDPLRSLMNPNSVGEHYTENNSGCLAIPGQPDTYLGTNWQNSAISCDFFGAHVNAGVQNYWFYLLSEGGNDINDLGNSFNVNGIGTDDASLIAYWNMVNVLQSGSQYSDARMGALIASMILFGECSNQHYQTENAWYAVGLGNQSSCTSVLSLENTTSFGLVNIYPMPFQSQFKIDWENTDQFNIKIYSIDGKLLFTKKSFINNSTIQLPKLMSGVFIIELNDGEKVIKRKIIKD